MSNWNSHKCVFLSNLKHVSLSIQHKKKSILYYEIRGKKKLLKNNEMQRHMSALADFLAGLIIFEHVYGSKIRWSGP